MEEKMQSAAEIKYSGELILGDKFDELYVFFRKVWGLSHSYIVFMSDRCLDLDWVFQRLLGSWTGAGRRRIISDGAILLCAGELADCYRSGGSFPPIALVEDIIFHGGEIIRMLSMLEDLIVDKLDPIQGLRDVSALHSDVRRALTSAVDIYAFRVNRQSLLFEDSRLGLFRESHYAYTNELRELSQQISLFLRRAEVPNTGAALSFGLPDMKEPVSCRDWIKRSWQYRGCKQDIYFCIRSNGKLAATPGNFIQSVRVFGDTAFRQGAETVLTALTFWGEIPPYILDRICMRLIQELRGSGCPLELNRICSVLSSGHPMLMEQRMRFVSFLLSVICFQDFFSSHGLDLPPLRSCSNIDKIARGFSPIDDILEELEALYNTTSLWPPIKAVLCEELLENAGPLLEAMPDMETGRGEIHRINDSAEMFFYRAGMEFEEKAYRIIKEEARPASKELVPGSTGMWEYIRSVPEERQDISDMDKLTCLLALNDARLISISPEADLRGRCSIQLEARTEVLAEFSLPRRFHIFIPALALVEREHWRLKLDPQDAVKEFIRTLPERPDEYSGEEKDRSEQEFQALLELKKKGDDLTDLLYSCGQSMNGWNIDLATLDDWRDEAGGESCYSFVRHEAERQKFYIKLARDFLDGPA